MAPISARRAGATPGRLLRARRKGALAIDHPNTVLVIEDDAEMRRLVARSLERSGHSVVAARNGSEAIDWLGLSVFDGSLENAPALIVSDIRLTDFSGLDLLDALRETGERVPVILITGFPSPETLAEARALGALEVLEKPFDTRELCDAVRGALARARLAPPAARATEREP